MEDFDPTAIALDLDPLTSRMKGKAIHGQTPFDVPFISHIIGNLYQGGCAKGLVLPEEIEHVVSLYPWERYTIQHTVKTYMEVRMYDSENGLLDDEEIDRIAQIVADCMEDGPTLVHCQAGLNRSGLIGTRALMLAYGWDADTCIKVMRAFRSPAVLCNQAFEAWLRAQDAA